jgi:ribosomal protein S18 acetylase RimI-like enzyme
MSLPEPVRAFCYAACALEDARLTPWGVVASDRRYPLVWDANDACIFEPSPTLTLAQIRHLLHPALRQAGAPFEHVEFWETSVESPALRDMRATGERPDPDVLMVYEGEEPADLPLEVRHVSEPDAAFWEWYRPTLLQFGEHLSDEVLDQMVARIRDDFVPAGLRWYVGSVEGEPAGYTSVISLEGTGYLDNVVTMPAFRRRGVASATVTRAVRECMRQGDRCVFLLAEDGGAPQRLYESLGFRVATKVESFTRPLLAGPPLGRATSDL